MMGVLSRPMRSMATVFISYRREDSAGYAARLREELAERLGSDQVFRDLDTLRPGQDFEQTIRQRLAGCRACVVVIGPGWLNARGSDGARRLDQPGDYVVMEVAAALARPGVLVVPVLTGGAAMPRAEDLPAAIEALARRHAISVRDETWEADMNRVAAALRAAVPDLSGPRASARPETRWATGLRRYVMPLGLAGAVLLAVWLWPLGDIAGRAPGGADAYDRSGTGGTPAGSEAGPAQNGSAALGPAFAIDVPARSEIRLEDVIVAVLAGSMQSRGPTTRVWLRIRASNEHFVTSTNLSDASFQLVSGSEVRPANGGLNEILGNRSVRQYVISFDVPSGRPDARLRVTHRGTAADIPIELKPNGQPARHEDRDETDSLSHATIIDAVGGNQALVASNGTSTTVTRVRVRRFLNMQRVSVVVRWTNDGRFPIATGDLVLRIAVGGEVRAPVSAPRNVIEPGGSDFGDIVFEVPPDASSVVLRATLGDATAEMSVQF